VFKGPIIPGPCPFLGGGLNNGLNQNILNVLYCNNFWFKSRGKGKERVTEFTGEKTWEPLLWIPVHAV